MKAAVGVGLLVSILCIGSPAAADQILFGSTGGTAQDLILTLKNGASYTFTTQGSLNPGGFDQGWWMAAGPGNAAGNTNYIVGTEVGQSFNDFFTFDIGGAVAGDLVNNPVVSATLRINALGDPGIGYPFTYSLFDVSTPAATLNNTVGSSASIFADLGSGVMYGAVPLTADPTAPFDIALNADAVGAINGALIPGALVYFSIGGTLAPATAPEPATLTLLGLGLAGLAASRRRKQ